MTGVLRAARVACAMLAWSVLIAVPVAAAPTPEQTLNDDVLGPRVDWYGAIERTISGTDHTCFILQRLTGNGYGVIAGSRFVTCGFGIFDADRFAPGTIVNVIGNLGAARPRTIGGQVFDYPLVASPQIRPATPAAPDYYWNGTYPGPYGAGWGPEYGYGLFYFR